MFSLKSLFYVLFSAIVLHTFAQDIHFSQFMEAPLTLNPALTGAFAGDLRAATSYKDQWRSVASPYKTFAIAVDAKFLQKKWKNGYLGLGGLVFIDQAGDAQLSTNNYNLNVSSGIYLNRYSTLAGGISAAYGTKSINYAALTWDNQYDQNTGTLNTALPSGENFANSQFGYVDFSAGVDYNFTRGEMYSTANDKFRINVGAAYYHINRPSISFLGASDRLYGKIVVHGNALIGIKNSLYSVVPSILYLRQGPNQEINFGTMIRVMLQESSKYTGYFKESAFSFGAYYRHLDAIVAAAYFEMANYGIGFSYDINVSELRAASSFRGGFELSLRYVTPNPFDPKTRPIYDLN